MTLQEAQQLIANSDCTLHISGRSEMFYQDDPGHLFRVRRPRSPFPEFSTNNPEEMAEWLRMSEAERTDYSELTKLNEEMRAQLEMLNKHQAIVDGLKIKRAELTNKGKVLAG